MFPYMEKPQLDLTRLLWKRGTINHWNNTNNSKTTQWFLWLFGLQMSSSCLGNILDPRVCGLVKENLCLTPKPFTGVHSKVEGQGVNWKLQSLTDSAEIVSINSVAIHLYEQSLCKSVRLCHLHHITFHILRQMVGSTLWSPKIPCSCDTILHSGERGLPFRSRAWRSMNAFIHNELCSSEIHPSVLIGREALHDCWCTVEKPATLSQRKLHQPRWRQAHRPWISVDWCCFTGVADDATSREWADLIR